MPHGATDQPRDAGGVADVETPAALYRGLDLPEVDIGSDDVAFFTLEGTWLGRYQDDLLAAEVHEPPAGEGDGGVTLAHNVGSRVRIDAVLAEAEAAGAEIRQRGVERHWGGYSGYFADPDGHCWEVAWNTEFEIG